MQNRLSHAHRSRWPIKGIGEIATSARRTTWGMKTSSHNEE
tara:strand:+ start:351 stop:473 length:123 start_codon:yes stop_codon:yes gene_type:complete